MKYKSILLFVSAVMVCLCCSSLGIANEEASASSPTVPAEQSAQNPEQAQPAPAQPAPVPQTSTPVPAEKNSVQQSQASAQDGAEESAFKSIWFWVALALLILVICIKFRIHCSALSRASGRVSGIEETPEASSNPTGKWSEYLTILDGERFRPGEELYEKSVEKAQKQAQTFIDALKEKMIASPEGLNTIPVQEELQAVANSLHPKFVESICSPSSYWMKKTFTPEKSAPSDLAKLITHFLGRSRRQWALRFNLKFQHG